MKTIAQWKARLPDLQRILKNTEARANRARDKLWERPLGEPCTTCGNRERTEPNDDNRAKWDLENALSYKQRRYIFAIHDWLYILKAYNKGEPSEPS